MDVEVHYTHKFLSVSPATVRCRLCDTEMLWNSAALSSLDRPCVGSVERGYQELTLYLVQDPTAWLDLTESDTRDTHGR